MNTGLKIFAVIVVILIVAAVVVSINRAQANAALQQQANAQNLQGQAQDAYGNIRPFHCDNFNDCLKGLASISNGSGGTVNISSSTFSSLFNAF